MCIQDVSWPVGTGINAEDSCHCWIRSIWAWCSRGWAKQPVSTKTGNTVPPKSKENTARLTSATFEPAAIITCAQILAMRASPDYPPFCKITVSAVTFVRCVGLTLPTLEWDRRTLGQCIASFRRSLADEVRVSWIGEMDSMGPILT